MDEGTGFKVRPGDVLVSSTAHELSAGSGFSYEGYGVHHLKGIPPSTPPANPAGPMAHVGHIQRSCAASRGPRGS
jgi:hypothetical protein